MENKKLCLQQELIYQLVKDLKIYVLNQADVDGLQELMDNTTMDVILAHAPYIINLASKSEKTRNNAYEIFEDDLKRLDNLPNNMNKFHPGSHVQQGDEIGRTFEELESIIEKIDMDEKVGVCIDTCHIYDGGYDIVNDLDGVIDEFDSIIGLDRLKAIHLNDSKYGLNSHKDRHEKIGMGKIGIDAITEIINHKKLRDLPFYLETPNDVEGYKEEIGLLRGLYK